MINSIIEAVSVSLNEEFGDDYEIHMEEIGQDLKEPCFFIVCLNPQAEQFLGNRYFRNIPFMVQYFPHTEKKQRECNEVAERMASCLEYITTDNDEKPILGTGMKWEVIDGVLNFRISYNLFVIKTEEQTAMETMQSQQNVKDGD